ncbi:MAG TPA: hypothetical protein VE093_03125 [Polyangiaceae bacterium]|nr:hypothetical protein [Polyangiaceae bacterium]
MNLGSRPRTSFPEIAPGLPSGTFHVSFVPSATPTILQGLIDGFFCVISRESYLVIAP